MNKQTEALKMAIEAIEKWSDGGGDECIAAIQACKEALEHPIKKVKLKFFKNEGYVDYGFYLFVDGKPETFENSQDQRYPHQLVFADEERALAHFLETRYGIEIEYE